MSLISGFSLSAPHHISRPPTTIIIISSINWPLSARLLSCVQLFVAPWTAACQVPLPMEFSRHEYWSGLPFPSPKDLPDPGIKPVSPALEEDSLPLVPPGKPWPCTIYIYIPLEAQNSTSWVTIPSWRVWVDMSILYRAVGWSKKFAPKRLSTDTLISLLLSFSC